MENFLRTLLRGIRDNSWQFLAVVVTILIANGWIGRQYKDLSYEIISDAPVAPGITRAGTKIRLLFNDVEVPRAQLMLIRIWNAGNLPIVVEDFAQPISIINRDEPILSADVVAQTPANLIPLGWSVKSGATERIVELPPLLLNECDSFTVQLILAEPAEGISVEGRIAGVKDIESPTQDSARFRWVSLLGLAIVIVFIIFLLFRQFFLGININDDRSRLTMYIRYCWFGLLLLGGLRMGWFLYLSLLDC